jgi:hypothetical protein
MLEGNEDDEAEDHEETMMQMRMTKRTRIQKTKSTRQ